MNVKRFPDCAGSEHCIQEQGIAKNYKEYNALTHTKKHRSVAVAMAGKIRGAINACLDFLLHFFVNPDEGGIGETIKK